jgi:uncharacterized membrane protein YgaE (UPF0421/DUF939 family)
MTLGATVSWWIAVELGARRPIFAALVPLVAMTGDPFAAVSVSISRVIGVFVGVGIGIGVAHLDVSTTVKVAIALLVGTLIATSVQIGGRPNLEVPIAALFLIGFQAAGATQLGVQRIWETAIGGVVAVAVSALVWPPDPVRQLERDLRRLREEVVDDLLLLADDLATGSRLVSERLDDIRAHSVDAVRDVFELENARRSLRWNRRGPRDQAAVEELERRINLAARVYRHTRSLARDVADLPTRDEVLAAATRDLADATDRTLRGEDAAEPLARAEAKLQGGSWLAMQLRQLHADVAAATRRSG